GHPVRAEPRYPPVGVVDSPVHRTAVGHAPSLQNYNHVILPGEGPVAQGGKPGSYLFGVSRLMSARTDRGSRSMARSPMDTMPTGRPPSSTPGSPRMARARMSRIA